MQKNNPQFSSRENFRQKNKNEKSANKKHAKYFCCMCMHMNVYVCSITMCVTVLAYRMTKRVSLERRDGLQKILGEVCEKEAGNILIFMNEKSVMVWHK